MGTSKIVGGAAARYRRPMLDGWRGGFDWDEGNRIKCQKHGVSLAEIEGVFDRQRFFLPDALHSRSEARFLAVCVAGPGRPVFVVFTVRTVGDTVLVRPISARYMHRQEVAGCVEAFSNPDDR